MRRALTFCFACLLPWWSMASCAPLATGVSSGEEGVRAVPEPGLPEPVSPESVVLERVVVAMGTSLHLQVVAATRSLALRASEAGLQALAEVDARLSTWREDSELAQLNRLPSGQHMELSPALLADLRSAARWCDATNAAFDPGIGALVDLYALRQQGRWPSDAEVAGCQQHTGMRLLQLHGRGASRATGQLRIEEGGFGKGAGLDAASAAVLAAGALAVTFEFGGQVVMAGQLGAKDTPLAPGGWPIADPRQRTRPVVRVRVARGSLATTANSERRLQVGDRDVGHILDPRTGRPAADFGSVTVWAQDALAADCLSTALFVMGPEAALLWAEQHDGIEALVLDATKEQLTARVTSGLRGRVTALVPDIHIL